MVGHVCGRPEPFSASQVDYDTFRDSQSLGFVDGQSIPGYDGKLQSCHPGPFLPAEFWEDWYPFWLVGIKCWATIIRNFKYESFGEGSNSGRPVHNTDKFATCTVSQTVKICHIAGEHDWTIKDQADDLPEAIERRRRLPLSTFGTTMLGLDLMNQSFFVFGLVRKFSPVTTASIFTSCAEPYRVVFEVVFLLGVEMAAI